MKHVVSSFIIQYLKTTTFTARYLSFHSLNVKVFSAQKTRAVYLLYILRFGGRCLRQAREARGIWFRRDKHGVPRLNLLFKQPADPYGIYTVKCGEIWQSTFPSPQRFGNRRGRRWFFHLSARSAGALLPLPYGSKEGSSGM